MKSLRQVMLTRRAIAGLRSWVWTARAMWWGWRERRRRILASQTRVQRVAFLFVMLGMLVVLAQLTLSHGF